MKKLGIFGLLLSVAMLMFTGCEPQVDDGGMPTPETTTSGEGSGEGNGEGGGDPEPSGEGGDPETSGE